MKTTLATNFSPEDVAKARAWIEAHTQAARSSRVSSTDIKRLSAPETAHLLLTAIEAALVEMGYDAEHPKLKLRVFNSDAPEGYCRRHHILKCADTYCQALEASRR